MAEEQFVDVAVEKAIVSREAILIPSSSPEATLQIQDVNHDEPAGDIPPAGKAFLPTSAALKQLCVEQLYQQQQQAEDV